MLSADLRISPSASRGVTSSGKDTDKHHIASLSAACACLCRRQEILSSSKAGRG